ncbi:MAG: hypothetical protein RQ966_09670 [Acetobacteraceae bacterium]|nr:hypothetical protein [Acetobacteraceae bacterium]
MNPLVAFRATLAQPAPDAGADLAIQGLWWAAKGDWDRAHQCVQQREGVPRCDLVHAHLHRLEGDEGNAAYWYRRAGRAPSTLPLAAEWESIVTELLTT